MSEFVLDFFEGKNLATIEKKEVFIFNDRWS